MIPTPSGSSPGGPGTYFQASYFNGKGYLYDDTGMNMSSANLSAWAGDNYTHRQNFGFGTAIGGIACDNAGNSILVTDELVSPGQWGKVYKSTDGGHTWAHTHDINKSSPQVGGCLRFGNGVWLLANTDGSIFRSTDQFATFTTVIHGVLGPIDMVLGTGSNWVLMSTRNIPGTGFGLSNDDGQTWTTGNFGTAAGMTTSGCFDGVNWVFICNNLAFTDTVIAHSSDGSTWTVSADDNGLYGVAWSGTKYLSGGCDSAIDLQNDVNPAFRASGTLAGLQAGASTQLNPTGNCNFTGGGFIQLNGTAYDSTHNSVIIVSNTADVCTLP